MKRLASLLLSACCLLPLTGLCAGHTGSGAAELITSKPDAKSSFDGKATLEIVGTDVETGEPTFGSITIGKDTDWTEVEYYTEYFGYSIDTVAQTALMALAKAAYLEAKDQFTQQRIDTLTESVQKAFRALDTIDLVDDVNGIKKTLSKRDKADDGMSGNVYYGPNIFNVSAAQSDGKSIVSNAQDKLALYGFPQLSASDNGKLPAFQFDENAPSLGWFFLRDLLDNKSVGAVANSDATQRFIPNGGIQIAGWDAPGTSPHRCAESIAAMLKRTASDPAPTPEQDPANHLVLTRYSGGSDPVMHFTPIGSLGAVGGGSAIKFVGTEGKAVVGTGAKTNTVTFSKFSDSNVRIKVEQSGDNATITFGVYYQ